MGRSFVRLFFVAATLEALSWLGLLAGMYVKYFTDGGELGVQIFGPLHGGVFVAYVLLTLLVARTLRWPAWVTLVALACSVPPFATLLFEWWAVRAGRLRWPVRGSGPQLQEGAQDAWRRTPPRPAEQVRTQAQDIAPSSPRT